jgi:hypothetical protein
MKYELKEVLNANQTVVPEKIIEGNQCRNYFLYSLSSKAKNLTVMLKPFTL